MAGDFNICMKAMARTQPTPPNTHTRPHKNTNTRSDPDTLHSSHLALFRSAAPPQCCPCVYYGQNMRRALLLNGYLHCLAFIVGMDLFWLVGSILRVGAA